MDDVTARLKASKQFDVVEVRKRFASIEDPSRIALVIIVNEGPVRIESHDGALSIARRRGLRRLMVLPVITAEDGYGFTYGAQFAWPGPVGAGSRLSFPLTWGGIKRAGVELDRPLAAGPFSRATVGAAIERRKNPAFQADDGRRRVWGRVERRQGPLLGGATLGWQRASFEGAHETFRSVGADLSVDTRQDPVLARNAVYAAAAWERLDFGGGRVIDRTRLDARGYLGLVGQAVLAVRAMRTTADRSQPAYLKPLLGGWSSLRGFAAGAFVGDTVVVGSAELRVPLNSPLQIAKVGVNLFVDVGTAYDRGLRYRDQTLHRGVGGGVWMTATVFHVGVSVARADDGRTRVNFGGGVGF